MTIPMSVSAIVRGAAPAVVALALTAASPATDLNPAAMQAFERYARLTEARIEKETSGAAPLLWVDRKPAAQRSPLMNQLGRGEVVVSSMKTRDGNAEIDVPDGLIHHWIGTVFMPNVKLDRVIAFVQDYPRYPAVFAPLIQEARVLRQSPDRFDVMMRTWGKKVLEVVIEADYAVEYRRLGPTKVYTRSVATNIHEIQSPGTASQTRVPAAKSRGFLWALNTYCSFEERTEGTYEQCESISLSRNAPLLVRPIVNPIAQGLPRETLSFTLGKVRAGVSKS
jgi:hypothetical protein